MFSKRLTARFVQLLLLSMLISCESEQQPPPIPSLMDAAEQGNLPAMDDFLVGEQMVNMRNACLWTPLMKASINGHFKAVEKLLNKGAEVDLVDKGGYSAMMLAASNNFAPVVELLIQRGAEVDRVELSHGWTALIWAAKRGHEESVRVLLKYSANHSVKDDENKTAMQYAQENGFKGIASLLKDG